MLSLEVEFCSVEKETSVTSVGKLCCIKSMQTCSVFTSLVWTLLTLILRVLAFNTSSNCASSSFDMGWQRETKYQKCDW